MALTLVAQVKCVVFRIKTKPEYTGYQCLMLEPCPSLATVWTKLSCINAYRCAGLTPIAVGPVSKHAAATKASSNQLRVG